MKHLLFAAAVALLFPTAMTAQDNPETKTEEYEWLADFDQAVEAAKKAKKELFVDFTGSDWCGWCKRLDKEVFDHEEFLGPMSKTHILVALDFPQADQVKAKVPNPERNAALLEKYGVQGFPTILLMTVDGEVYASTGYQAGGPENYVDHLHKISEAGKKALVEIKGMVKAYEAAGANDRPALVEKAIQTLSAREEGDRVGLDLILGIVRQGLTLDPDNASGLKLKAMKAIIKADQANADEIAAARAMDPKNEAGVLELIVRRDVTQARKKEDLEPLVLKIAALDALGPIKDKEIAKFLFATAAVWKFNYLEDKDGAKVWAKKAQEFAADDERLAAMLEQILGDD